MNKGQQVTIIKERLNQFLEVLDTIEPETTDVQDIDKLIEMIDELEETVEKYKQSNEE